MAISINQKPTIYRNLYENTDPGAFSVDAPRLWNEFPLEIRSSQTQIRIRKKLKAYFFGQDFRT